MPDEIIPCHICGEPARVTIKTRRNSRTREMTTQVWWDERTGPKDATRYCKLHGERTLSQLAGVLIDEG